MNQTGIDDEAEEFHRRLDLLNGRDRAWTSVTTWLIAANVAAFVAMGLAGAGWLQYESMRPYRLYGANNLGVTAAMGQWWRLVSCMFLHFGLLHLAFNMWTLFDTGRFLERLLGRPLYVLTYFGSGIVASLSALVWQSKVAWSAGASGAVFGTVGALIGCMARQHRMFPRSLLKPMMRSIAAFIVYNFAIGIASPQISNSGHLGGLAGGLVLGWIVALPLEPDARARGVPLRLALGFLALGALTAVGVQLALRRI